MRAAALLIALASLSACAGAPRGPSTELINRVLERVPGAAQPSTLVATELAFSRQARRESQSSAAQFYAAPGARLHFQEGLIAAEPAFGRLNSQSQPYGWSPRVITMSCDGALAASLGRYQDEQGFVGNYVKIWRRNAENDYRWTYHAAGRDDPQPPPREEPGEGDIVVTAIDAIEGRVADCPRRDAPVPPPPSLSLASDNPGGSQLSRDGTMRWYWEHLPDGTKLIAVDYFFEGDWQTIIEERLASLPE